MTHTPILPVNSPVITSLALFIGLYGTTTSNPMETIWTGFMFWFICHKFWWQNTPGIVLFAFVIPFIEIHTGVLNANSSNISLDTAFNGTGQLTFWLSSIGLFFVSIGFSSVLNKPQLATALHTSNLRKRFEGVNITHLILTYLALTLMGTAVDAMIPWNSSLKQLEVQFLKLPSVALFAACVHFYLFRKQGLLFSTFLVLVIIQNLYSYFSTWRLPIEILIAASLLRYTEFKMNHLIRYLPLLIPTLLFVGIWQSIKGEYRYQLSGGLENQQINISRGEALQTALDLGLKSYEEGDFADSTTVQATFQRTGYLEYFAATIEKVPEEIPFEKGKLTADNLEYALIPRILNPNKALKDDRAKVEKYTGIYFGGERAISSFSLGHYCEAYIDWGPIAMMIHLFLYGCIGGWITNLFTSRQIVSSSIFGTGILFTILSFWGTYQKDMVTIVGSLFWGGLAFIVLFPPLLLRIKNK